MEQKWLLRRQLRMGCSPHWHECGVLVDRVAWVEDKLLWWLERELLS